jgi:DNA-directed RNA polymerase beta subunit
MSRIPLERKCSNTECKTKWFRGEETKKCPTCGKKSLFCRGGGSIKVGKGDVIIGKIIVNGNKAGEETKTDVSRIIQLGEEGVIDRVHSLITPNGYKLIKVVIRKLRQPIMGDKVASRSAQKGTIGKTLRHEDMPFTDSGVVPDIIINPMCITSQQSG